MHSVPSILCTKAEESYVDFAGGARTRGCHARVMSPCAIEASPSKLFQAA